MRADLFRPKVSYLVTSGSEVPGGNVSTKVGFNEKEVLAKFLAGTDGGWNVTATINGLYFISVSATGNRNSDFQIVVKSDSGDLLTTEPSRTEAVNHDTVQTLGLVYLKKGQRLWVEAYHSGSAGFRISAGRFVAYLIDREDAVALEP